MNQREKYQQPSLSVEFIGGEHDPEVSRKVLDGKVQLVFITPESAINNRVYRNMFLSPVYQQNLRTLVVDECHCVKLWGDQFRRAFSEIGTLRSVIPRNVNILALTATATTETFHLTSKSLGMTNAQLVSLPPHRDNIRYEVAPKVTMMEFVATTEGEKNSLSQDNCVCSEVYRLLHHFHVHQA